MKTLRTLTLTALVLTLISAGLPARDALARLSRRAVAAAHRRGNHRHCHHSRAWWRNYRRRARARQQLAAQRRLQRSLTERAAKIIKDTPVRPSFVPLAAPAPSIPAQSANANKPAVAATNKPAVSVAGKPAVVSSNNPPALTIKPATSTDKPAVAVSNPTAPVVKQPAPAPAKAVTAHKQTVPVSAPAPVSVSAPSKSAAAAHKQSTPSFRKQAAPASAPEPTITRAARVEPTFRTAKVDDSVPSPAPQQPARRNPFDFALPPSWRLTGANGQGILKFAVTGGDGRATGTATLAPFNVPAASAAQDIITPRTRLLGGVPLPVLRRTVIERMVSEGGWVVNDFERQIEGRAVYVVTAQTGRAGHARESLTFYFTEVEGRLYALATNAPVEFSAPVAADSEQLLATMRSGQAGNAAAKSPR